jgi:ferric-dicitrate binding protein FerR (iron transport regulator)
METNHPTIPDSILELLALKAGGRLSPARKKILADWISDNPRYQKDCEVSLAQFQKHFYVHLHQQVDQEKAWQTIRQKTGRRKPLMYFTKRWAGIAAIALVLLGIGWAISTTNKKAEITKPIAIVPQIERGNKAVLILSDGNQLLLDNTGDTLLQETGGVNIRNKAGEMLAYSSSENPMKAQTLNTLIIPAGARYQVQLSDGTQVWMNSASQLEYPVAFAKGERKVKLTGEAFFEVSKDAACPFIIEANGYEVKVLGTAFNVSAYATDAFMETTLVSGSVKVTSKNGEVVRLEPDQMLRINNQNQTADLEKVDTRFYTSWKDGILYFDNLPMEELARRLERWYDVKIVFSNEKTKQLRFSGAMENSRNIQFLLNLISQTTNIKFSQHEKTITVE